MADKQKIPSVHVTSDDVITKYKEAAAIAQKALSHVITLCVPGAKIVDICAAGDALIVAETAPLYKTQKLCVKGYAFPTSIAVNNIVGHVSPLADNTTVLAENDVVKIDLGVAVDGYAALVAHTIVLAETVTGKNADVVAAVYAASKAAADLLKVGNTNDQITAAVVAVAAEYGVNPVLGVLSHNLTRFRLDGDKVICQVEEPDRKANTITFEEGEAYAVDIVFSTGDGKPSLSEEKTTIYKRDPTKKPSLKIKASQTMLTQIDRSYPCFPFSLRSLENKSASLGVVECIRTGALETFPVLIEKKTDVVAQARFTVLLLSTGAEVVTGDVCPSNISSEKTKK